MGVEFVPSDPNMGPAPTMPRLSLETIAQRDTEHVVAVIAAFVFLGVAMAVFALMWSHRRGIVAAVDGVVVDAVARTLKSVRRFWQRVENRAS